MTLSPYLFFDGTCREAFEFYRSVFGGEFTYNVSFKVGVPVFDIAEADMDRVVHIELPVGSTLLRGCDQPTGHAAEPPTIPSFAVAFNGDSREQCDEIFAQLAIGGQILLLESDSRLGDYFGLCRDRFGVHWIVSWRRGLK